MTLPHLHVTNATLDFLERWQGRILAAMVAAVLLTAVVATCASAQVASAPTFVKGQLATVVVNPSPTDTLAVGVALRWAHVEAGRVVLDSAVRALVSPAAFTLPPGARQTVRLRLKEPVAPGTVLRLVWTFDPVERADTAAAAGAALSARLVVRTVLVAKATVQ